MWRKTCSGRFGILEESFPGMPFHIQPIREFLVRPALPDSLDRMTELAYNLLWSWVPIVRALFRRLDPVLWRECGYNPVLMLGRVSQSTLQKAASDPRYLSLYRAACESYDAHVKKGPAPPDGKLVAYFSAEYGLTECLPVYSGGLGILSGDHLKSSSDQDYPLIAFGLLYQQGYFRQMLNPDGWQQERYPTNDFYTLPIRPVKDAAGQDLKVTVRLPTGNVYIQVWKLEVGRVTLHLLDTNIPENVLPQDRDITDSLYGGDTDTRMRQEIVLGIGGMRALKAMGLRPTVFHMNEGHSAFLALEQMRLYMREEKLTFEEALMAARSSNVFTTHTPVPAGIDLFDPGLMYHYFSDLCGEIGIDFHQLMALGRRNAHDRDERFSMAVLALNTSSYRNAVSRLHRQVSQEMFHDLWPQLPVWEVPVTSITNGVHQPSWLNGDLAGLYDQYLAPDWRERFNEPSIWDQVRDIPDEELLEVHRRRKRRLVNFVRERQQISAVRRQASAAEVRRASEVLDPNAFTIGFARRFATYKRATLLFRDVERLKRILLNKDMPVQLVIAGKAHPKDHPGKSYIREVVQFSRDPDLWKYVVFVEDYDMKVGREMVQGVDLWLNNPRRGEEACGTSGMKAGMNGILNLSILDGWFDEAYEKVGRLGDRRARALLGRPGCAARQRHLLPAGKRDRAHVLRSPRADAAGVDAARQTIADVHHAAVRLPPHGARLHDRAVQSGAHAAHPHAAGRLQHGAGEGALGSENPRGVGPRALRRSGRWPFRIRDQRQAGSRARGRRAGRPGPGRRARGTGDGPHRQQRPPGGNRGAGVAGDGAAGHGGGVRQGCSSRADRPSGLRVAGKPEPF